MPTLKRRYKTHVAAAALALLAACAGPTKLPPPIEAGGDQSRIVAVPQADFPAQVRVERAGTTCRTATKVARATLKRMGYDVQSVVPATAERAGEVRALRHTGWYTGDPGDSYGVAVRITCNDTGAVLEAATEEPLAGRMAFKRDFPTELEKAAARRIRRPRVAARQPLAKLRVSIEPLRGGAAAAVLGASPQEVGLTPLHVRIVNDSTSTYRFDASRLRLRKEGGGSTRPLSLAEVEGRLADEWRSHAREKWVNDGTISPGTTVEGYLYVPAAAYRRAKVSLIEAESEEAEGFSVEF